MVSNAERQRLYRQRRNADPERRVRYLKQKQRKYKQDIEVGKRKRVLDMTEREKISQRKGWKYRQNIARRNRQLPLDTPPNSPVDNIPPPQNNQRNRGRRQIRKNRAKCYRTIQKLESALDSERRRSNRFQKRYERLLKSSASPSTPRTKTRKLLKHMHRKPNTRVRKTLTFHFSLLADIRQRLKESKTERQRQTFCRFLSGKIIKKYKLRKFAEKQLGVSQRRWYKDNDFNCKPVRRINPVHSGVVEFYLRDDNSRMTTGVKNTKTVRKVKKQRRLLLDTLLNLHRKYEAEKELKVSYSTFCRMRPFWVMEPRDIDRETCLCKKHENLKFLADKVHSLGLINTSNIETLAKGIMCSEHSKDCAYDTCESCKDMAYPGIFPLPGNMDSQDIMYPQWGTKKVTACDDSNKEFSIVAKEELTTTVTELIDKFQDSLHQFKKHNFNISNQYKSYRYIRENLTEEACLIHIEFSENYCGKYSKEIQSVHFGGSHQQISLHTGMLYLQSGNEPFCSISPNTQHDPSAIWVHLTPILQMLIEKYPLVKTLHFFSDGPTSQYRQKANFYRLATIPFDMGFRAVCWHFFESSHGKGAPDGIGGFLKRTADRQVKLGKDIPSATTFFDILKSVQSSVKLYYISEHMIREGSQSSSTLNLPTIKGTMRLHQMVSIQRGIVTYRDVSCICGLPQGTLNCSCHTPKLFDFNTFQIAEVKSSRSTLESDSSNKHRSESNILSRPDVIDASHIGQHCVVVYDDKPYPGVIVGADDDDDVEIKCMAALGKNRFFWPSVRDDVSIYSQSDIICFINEPVQVNRRSWQLENTVWSAIEKAIDL